MSGPFSVTAMRTRLRTLGERLARPRDWLSPRRKRFWAVVLLLAYTLAGFLLVPWVAERQIVAELTDLLERPVTLEQVRVNPFVLSAEAREFAVTEPDGAPLLGFDRLYVNFQLSSLFRWAWTFREITLENPSAEVIRAADGSLNLARLLPPAAPEPAAGEDAGLVRLVVHELNLVGGRAQFDDYVPATPFHTPVGPIDVSIRSISTLPEVRGEQQVVVHTERGTRLAWDGSVSLQPLRSEGRLRASGPYLPVLYRYFQDHLNVIVEEGLSDISLSYAVSVAEDGEPNVTIDALEVALTDIRLRQDDTTVLRLPEIRVAGGTLAYPARTAGAERLAITGAQVHLWRASDGVLSVEQLLTTPPQRSGPLPPAPTPSGDEAHTTPAAATPSAGPAPPAEDPWSLHLSHFELADLSLTFEDRALRVPGMVEIAELDIAVSDISNQPGARFPVRIASTLGAGGGVGLEGTVGAVPEPVLNATLSLDAVEIAALQPYLTDVAAVVIDDGRLGLDAELTVDTGEPLAASGSLAFEGLSVSDGQQHERLVGWQGIDVDRFEYSAAANSLQLSEVVISAPYVRLLIAEDQSTNFQQLMVGDEVEADEATTASRKAAVAQPAGSPTGEPDHADSGEDGARGETAQATAPRLTVGRIRVEDGSADFTDLALPLPFRSRIADLNGELTTFDTASAEPARIRLEGQIDDYGLARIQGALLPLGPDQATDIELLFRNVALPDLTPYTIRFAGREIADGRMELDLVYRVNAGQLVGENNIVISDMQLGDKVEHPDAFDVPLGLAVALLKGPDGRISVDVPVAGDVNDPEFRLGGVIARAIFNLLTNVVTSPFRLLGSLVGAESENFDRIEFEPGRSDLTPPEREKLVKLSEALALRPELELLIPPVWDPAADHAALQTLAVDARIEEALAAAAPEADDALLGERRRAAIESLFTSQFPETPLEPLQAGFQTPIDPEAPESETRLDEVAYVAELRSRLIAAAPVAEGELEALAAARADAVGDAVTADERVSRDRILTAEASTVDAGDGGWIGMKLDVDSRSP